MMSMWKKIKKLFKPDSDSSEKDDSELEFVTFQEKDPRDVTFTKNFIAGGGMFLYCENEQATLENLKSILDNEMVSDLVCFEEKLINLRYRLGTQPDPDVKNDLYYPFISC